MFVALEFFFDVAGHRNVKCPSVVVPGEFDAAVEIAAPILAQFLYLSFIAAIKCSTSFFLVYLTPKSSTTRVKEIGRVVCFQKPGVCLHS